LLRCNALTMSDTNAAAFVHSKLKHAASDSAKVGRRDWLHTGVGLMKKLVEIRSQEFMCRERATLDSERKIFWLAQAEEWEQRALDEIAFHFRECNLGHAGPQVTSH
jgi:hypothetical protein